MISGYKRPGIWWFRVFGWGLTGKDIRTHPLLFSERHGHVKYLQINNWSFKALRRLK